MSRVRDYNKIARWGLIGLFIVATIAGIVLSWRTDRSIVSAKPSTEITHFYRARVAEVLEEGERQTDPGSEKFKRVKATVLEEGDYHDQSVEFEISGLSPERPYLNVKLGEKVVLMRADQSQTFYLANTYRLPQLIWFFAIFIGVVLLLSGRKGFFSLLGLGVSITVLIFYAVPTLLGGQSAVGVTMIAATLILAIALPLAHGFNLRTAIALVSSFGALGMATILSWLAVHGVRLFGTGSDEGVYLQFLGSTDIDTRGILLGGIIIGTIGVIDDIVASQVATIAEIKRANMSLPWIELFKRGLRVGREHIASLVNTLVLAYAGAALPLFLLFWFYQDQALWTVLNGDLVAEEITRSLVGSMTLVLAVPLATLLAAVTLDKISRSRTAQ